MKMNDIIEVIKMLACSQGFYGRMYDAIAELKAYDPQGYEDLVEDWESKNFADAVDFVMYVEGGYLEC